MAVSSALLAGCSSDGDSAGSSDQDLAASDPRASWIYDGPLPALEDVELTVSQKAHTLLVTGKLPDGFSGKLPFYVDKDDSLGRIALVYPIATGVSNRPKVTTPDDLVIYPHFIQADHFGGFPFMPYLRQSGGRVAFHGPITEDGPDWLLHRGPVSKGCNRMQGEHAVELAQILGVDMSQVYAGVLGDKPGTPPKSLKKLVVDPAFAVWKGRPVDVDFPLTQSGGLPVVPTKAENAMKFPTWDSHQYPRVVCRFKKGTESQLGRGYCGQVVSADNAANLFDTFAER